MEKQKQPVVDAKGEPKLHKNGKPKTETVEVEVEPGYEKKITPAGIDHSKLVPYLFAVIDDLRDRIEQLENQ